MTSSDPHQVQFDVVDLAAQARTYLSALQSTAVPITYQALARALQLKAPYTIYRVIQALELTMRQDAAADQPFVAARVISRTRRGLPAPGFFVLATLLGRHDGDEAGASAQDFHEQQLQALASNTSPADRQTPTSPD